MSEYQVSELYETIRESNPKVEMFGADLWLNFTIDFKEYRPITDSMNSVIKAYQLAGQVLDELGIRHDGIDDISDNLSLSVRADQPSIDHFKFYFCGEFVCEDDLYADLITEHQRTHIFTEFKERISEANLPLELREIQSKISIIVDRGEKISGNQILSESKNLLNSIKPLMNEWNLSDDRIYESGESMYAKYLAQEHMNPKPTDCLLFNFYNAI